MRKSMDFAGIFAAEKAGRDSLAARLPVSLGFTSQAFTEGTHAARFNKLLPPLVIGNLILQSLVFAAALLSLARQFNELSPIIIAVAEVVGLALLAAVTAALNYAKYHLTKLEEQAWFLEYYKSKAPSDAPASDGNDIGDADQVEG